MNCVADLLWLFRSFYIRRSSVESFVEEEEEEEENFILIRHIIKQYNISSKELFTEYTLTIKQHKSHAKLQTKIS
jgi:hypothetical protein